MNRRRLLRAFLAILVPLSTASVALAQSSSDAKPDPSPAPAQKPESSSEVSQRDVQPSFKVRVNLVQVRVVVRDDKGKVVSGLKRDDFQIFDNRKLQAISLFNEESRESHAVRNVATAAGVASDDAETAGAAVLNMPQRFVAIMFDDVHMSMQDTTFVRSAASRFYSSLARSDRVAMFTTSGQFSQDFSADKDAFENGLLRISPHPYSAHRPDSCPEISYYEADLIVNKHDDVATRVATADALECAFSGDRTQTALAASLAQSTAMSELSAGDAESEMVYRNVESTLRRLSGMPGQRVMVFVSPGFIPSTMWSEISSMIDRATRASIVINTIDARGLYTPDFGDIASPPRDSGTTSGPKGMYRTAAQSAQEEVLADFASGTGGTFFHNRNDIDEGLRQAAAAPEVSYVLGFSPQNLKLDGRFHTLKVALSGKQKYTLQARRGYYAPRTLKDPSEQAKEEIQEAVFSQEEIGDLPVDLQTQFFKTDADAAKLSVLSHFDVKGIPFRKAEGRNNDTVTIATAIFDENGNMITGNEKIVEMKLLDSTYTRLSRNGFTVKSSFDIKPGTYMVRMVVRDSEGAEMAARNGAVVIPY